MKFIYFETQARSKLDSGALACYRLSTATSATAKREEYVVWGRNKQARDKVESLLPARIPNLDPKFVSSLSGWWEVEQIFSVVCFFVICFIIIFFPY